jgi:hypothetical protein
LYEKAAQVICSGDLRQGKTWMERAIAEDNKQWTKVSSNVIDTNSLEFDNHGTFEAAYVQSLVDEAPATGACDLPPDVSVADEIMRVEQTVDDPMNRRRRRDPWWTLDEEEEEEEGNDGGGG